MCVSFCPRRRVLFWNHEDCEPRECAFAVGPHGSCATCRHHRDSVCAPTEVGRQTPVCPQPSVCALTNAPLPEVGGCCQHDIKAVEGLQEICWDMLAPLRIGPDETVEQFLKCYEVPYVHGSCSEVLVDPDDLGLPQTFGLGTEHLDDEEFDWTDWVGQWCLDDVPVAAVVK